MVQDQVERRTGSLDRRSFLRMGAAAVACGAAALPGKRAMANPLGLPLGLQLYSVREMLAKDYLGTLKQLAAIGYQEVEAAGFYGHTPEEVRAAMSAAGLSLVSAHYSANDLGRSFDQTLAFCKALGLQYMICSFPGIKDPARLQGKSFRSQVESFTMEDYRWNAERFNEWGRKAQAVGIRFGYHNHTMEFAPQGGVVPFDEMIRLTDPALVTFEMDCGWVTVGGGDPVAYLHKYPKRISMLHIKDFKTTSHPATVTDPPPAAELGRGTVDFRDIFLAAKGAQIRHAFVEQESFNLAPMESLRIDANYIKNLPS